MAIFKCKMCGGSLEIAAGTTVVECEYCGTTQTLPRLDDDRRANLYDRANHFRRNNEFDKAMGIYEQILNDDGTDAEAYWSLVLCRYGIEYVEDPTSHKRVPTVNRAQFTSIFDDNNYKSALMNADVAQKAIYEAEAKAINEIQKGILAISQNEEPFDVFICYKESDNNGRRTPDSVLAQDLYYQLTQEGFKVFFARITLEDKLGAAYEPYIFAALNSAKVMVVLGTKPEYFNAVWVKNEWSRYLALIKQGQKKVLVPAYKDMDPYDLPEEFSHLQAQDMAKLGFMQDLIRGIKKIAETDEPKASVVRETVVTGGNADAAPLLRRAFMFLEDGDWRSADEYCEKVLDIEPENAEAYVGKLMAELKVRRQEDLRNCAKAFDDNNYYIKAIRFADDDLETCLVEYIKHINARNEASRIKGVYAQAKSKMKTATTASQYKKAAWLFETIPEYEDSAQLASECKEKAEVARKDAILEKAKLKMSERTCSSYLEAIKNFESIPGWKDADDAIAACKKGIEEINVKAELAKKELARKAKRKKIRLITFALIAIAAVSLFTIIMEVIVPKNKYTKAVSLMEDGNIVEAYEILVAVKGYEDSDAKSVNLYEEYKKEKFKNLNAGDKVFFGRYEQDGNIDNAKEYISWLVLRVEDGKALLISEYGLAYSTYGNTDDWLRGKFTNSFTIPELSAIDGKKAVLPDEYGILRYLDQNGIDRRCMSTKYAGNGRYDSWWLSSPIAARYFIDSRGDRDVSSSYDESLRLVRPAIWVDLSVAEND